PPGVPILGVNLGRVGFMTEVRAEEALAKLDFYLKGSPRVEERTMLHAVVSSRGGGGGEVGARQEESIHGLNDVVVGREAVARLTSVAARVDGVQLTTYRADGVIVSTATGSTGYLVSVGGPIVHPELPVLLLRPIAPHLGLDIPLVLAADSSVELTVGQGYRALASVDGFMDRSLAEGDSVTVRRSPYKARFLRANPASHFYTVLTRRLGWSPSPEGDREEP
ncbi:MAG: NAD(+)/NADH kinase, partial [Chloroflexi bacterium]|nr:NAD(+)/NADH kinase [Chloroflexota bacterium]